MTMPRRSSAALARGRARLPVVAALLVLPVAGLLLLGQAAPAGDGGPPRVTRQTVLDTATALGLAVVERPFTVAEALAARETFITSASNTVMPVTEIDGAAIGDGRPGPVALRLREAFGRYADHASK